MKFESIIWDWNGTLLDDVDIAVAIINQLLCQRGLKPIAYEHYLEVFTSVSYTHLTLPTIYSV